MCAGSVSTRVASTDPAASSSSTRIPGSPPGVRTRSSGTLGAPVVVTPPRDSSTEAPGNATRSASSGSLMWGALTKALPPPCVNGCSALCPISAMLRMPAGRSGRMPPSFRSTTVLRAAVSVRKATTSGASGSGPAAEAS